MNIFKQAYFFLKYSIRANTLHGTHSPFVYQFLEQILYQKVSTEKISQIENIRKKHLLDTRKITIKDLGAGSQQNNNRIKEIKSIAKNALKPSKYAALYYRIIQAKKPKNIIELGTSLGITASYLAAATTENIYTLEGCPNTLSVAQETFNELGFKNIIVKEGNFDLNFPDLLNSLDTVDFVYFDGNHTKEATLRYFELALHKANENSIFIFDDIYWSEEMMDAWEIIKSNSTVTITIDLYFIGLVFFNKGQAKEHFTILYK